MASIEGHLPAGDALRRLALSQLALLARELAAAEQGANAHPMRKRLKFLRSLMRMLRPAIAEDAFQTANGHLRAAALQLALKRHGEAMVEAVEKLHRQVEGETQLISELELAAREHASHAEEAHSEGLVAARREIDAVRAQVAGWTLPRRERRFFLAGIQRCYARGRKLLGASLASGDTQMLHEARKSVIHHLHHLEILEPIWPRMMKTWCDELGRLRESLGDLNDLDELDGLLANPQTAFGRIQSCGRARELISARRLRLIERIRKRAGQLFAERPRSLVHRLDEIWSSWEQREA
ncbi:MAG: CHAD domain-containing protein [Rhizobiales bacterium]|nr:CHAD domain-containing protein [Hyphomicrobiales bacterium]